MIKRAIVVFPRLPVPEPIATLRRRFDPLADRVPPHLTLVFPFESTISLDDLCAHVEGAIHGIEPFPIKLAGITGSEDEYLFLTVKRGNDTLIELHDRLYTGLLRPCLSHRHAFTPHMTVGRLNELDAFDDAIRQVALLDIIVETEVSSVSIYRIEPDGRRPQEGAIALGQSGD